MTTRQDPPTAGIGPLNDRRVFVRHAIHPPCFLWVSLYPHPWRGAVIDLSASGLRFRAPLPFQPGWLLSLEFLDPAEERPEPKIAEVIHIEPDGADGYFVGAAFLLPLTENELQRYLTPADVS